MQINGFDLSRLFLKSELIPVVVQDADSGQVLMVGFADEEAVEKTADTGTAWFFSRSRNKLWNKGETSGNYLKVLEITADCDYDTLLYKCIPQGPTCHSGEKSCFHNPVWKTERKE
jgi:phosphoribosyl-AMP cyclohydrolase